MSRKGKRGPKVPIGKQALFLNCTCAIQLCSKSSLPKIGKEKKCYEQPLVSPKQQQYGVLS